MFQRILVILENETICDRALSYTLELARRMDSEVSFLMLVEMAFFDHLYLGSKRNAMRHLEANVGRKFGEISSQFLKEGISVSVAMRVGDAAQELMKFLIERPPFQAVIWGSNEAFPHRGQVRQGHWMRKVVDNLECPLFAVAGKRSVGQADK